MCNGPPPYMQDCGTRSAFQPDDKMIHAVIGAGREASPDGSKSHLLKRKVLKAFRWHSGGMGIMSRYRTARYNQFDKGDSVMANALHTQGNS